MGLMRRRRPLLRAAAVGGGAYMMGKRRAGTEQPEADAPAPPADQSQVLDQLKQLGQLHDQGVLTDEEFDQQKGRLLHS
jgi:hypothetical protein